jgi:hypothetical protein
MINFNLSGFYEALKMVSATIVMATSEKIRASGIVPPPLVPKHMQEMIKTRHEFIVHMCNPLLLEKTDARLTRISIMLNRQYTYDEVAREYQTLYEAIEDDIRTERFYHYNRDKALLVLKIQGDWAPTLAAFKSAKKDVEEAVDCYALEHETACVFYLMRILEHGLRELAAAVNMTFDIQQWQTIIESIESQIRDFGNNWKASPTKTEWMNFYSEAARHFFFLKDAWRNHVSHNRVTYDATSAKGAIEHIRDFMNHLSSRLGEVV